MHNKYAVLLVLLCRFQTRDKESWELCGFLDSEDLVYLDGMLTHLELTFRKLRSKMDITYFVQV